MKRALNISNYEEWMVDLMDGTLSSEDNERLQLFLAEHPELSVDIDLMQESVLIPDESVSLSMRSALKRDELEDEAIIALIEDGGDLDDLNDIERQLASIYAKTILEADELISYPDRASLRQSEGRVIPLWFKAVSIAASLLLAFFLIPSDKEPTYAERDGGPAVWEAFELDTRPYDEQILIAGETLDEGPVRSDIIKHRPTQLDSAEPLLVDVPKSEIPLPDNMPIENVELPSEVLSNLTDSTIGQPSPELSVEDSEPELADNSSAPKSNYTPVSKRLQAERPFTTALDLLKKATAGSEILAIQDVDPEASYVQTSLKLGRFEVAVKRKKKN